jgi:hypothetical protein
MSAAIAALQSSGQTIDHSKQVQRGQSFGECKDLTVGSEAAEA